jgi:hypothetical protein
MSKKEMTLGDCWEIFKKAGLPKPPVTNYYTFEYAQYIDRMRKALEFYADESIYPEGIVIGWKVKKVFTDRGEKARQALLAINKEEKNENNR